MKSFKRGSPRLTLRLSVKLRQIHKLPKWNEMKQRNIRNVLGLICLNPKPPHGVVVGWVSSVNPMSTRVYRPKQLVDCQVSLIKREITGCQVSHLKFLLCKTCGGPGRSCDKEKLELASKILRLPGCHNKSLLLNVYFAHLFILRIIHFIFKL